jgi:hypothetical protein
MLPALVNRNSHTDIFTTEVQIRMGLGKCKYSINLVAQGISLLVVGNTCLSDVTYLISCTDKIPIHGGWGGYTIF